MEKLPNSSQKSYTLLVISGKRPGKEFPLKISQETVIGRSHSADVVLPDEMVSRHHGRFVIQNEQVTLQDLQSSNGTFVNGQKITEAVVKPGDRIQIGTNVLNVLIRGNGTAHEGAAPVASPPKDGPASPAKSSSAPAVASLKPAVSIIPKDGVVFLRREKETTVMEAPPRSAKEFDGAANTTKLSDATLMSGLLDQIHAGDLLQLMSSSRKSGVLRVKKEDEAGSLYLNQGMVFYAELDECPNVDPTKAFFWMATWTRGTFELHPPADKRFSKKIEAPLDVLLMEAMRQHDERTRVTGEKVNYNATLSLATPLVKPLSSLAPNQLAIVQLVLNHDKLRKVLLYSALPDYETQSLVMGLIKDGYLKMQN